MRLGHANQPHRVREDTFNCQIEIEFLDLFGLLLEVAASSSSDLQSSSSYASIVSLYSWSEAATAALMEGNRRALTSSRSS